MSGPRRAYDLLRSYLGREYERITGQERLQAHGELEELPRAPAPSQEATPVPEETTEAEARRVLGVAEDADFGAIRKSFERLNRRSNPSQFPEGSQERAQAAEIHRRVNEAYRLLADGVPETKRRFKSLELD